VPKFRVTVTDRLTRNSTKVFTAKTAEEARKKADKDPADGMEKGWIEDTDSEDITGSYISDVTEIK
jgi:hypothetical protein